MSSTSTLPTCDSLARKTPVVVILKDSRISLSSQPENVITWYIDPLLDHLKEANQPRPCHVALVGYGSVHGAGSPLSTIPFSQLDPHNNSMKLLTSHKISENPPILTALDGSVAAIKMIEKFQRAAKQDPNEEFSYHLWHIAASQDDESAPSYLSFAQTFWNFTWDTIPAELQSRNINLSMILLSPCPRYSELFSAVSPQSIKPWFATCPHHTILLSGFEHPLTPKLEDTAPSTVPSKRSADTLVEHPARRLKTEDSSHSINIPSPPQLAYTSPNISQSSFKDSPIEPSPYEGQDMRNDEWSGTLSWSGEGSDVCASVQATDEVRDPQLWVWPRHLQLEIVGTGIRALDFQAWIFKHRASVVRIKCTTGMGEQDFGKLVKSLREDGRVAIVRFDSEIEGSPKRGLVLAPLHEGLLCTAFLSSDIPELPNAPLEQRQSQKELKADCIRLADFPFESAEYSQEDPCDNQTNTFVTGPLVQPTLSQQLPSQQQPTPVQELLSQRRAALDAQHALIGEFVSRNGELITTAKNNASVDFRLADSSWDVSSLYDGDMSGVGDECDTRSNS